MARMLVASRVNRNVRMVFDISLGLPVEGQIVTFTTGRSFSCSTTHARTVAIAKAISDEMRSQISEGMLFGLKNNPEQSGFRANSFLNIKVKPGTSIDRAINDVLDIIKRVCKIRTIEIVEKN